MEKSNLLQQIPAVGQLLEEFAKKTSFSRPILLKYIRQYLGDLRKKVLDADPVPDNVISELSYPSIRANIQNLLEKSQIPYVRRVLNATGVILHTGLGRAVLPPKALAQLVHHLSGYCVLEVDSATGERTVRDQAVLDMLTQLTQAEDATVVNNNAGAILLVLAALTQGKEVIVSRGQLVEIGGSFRVPDILAQSGSKLIEVGCTNCTHLSDYEKAITASTAAILQVHTSNYKIIGFTEAVSLDQLAKLARKKNIYLLHDAGSGSFLDFSPYKLSGEPIISASIAAGADIVTFSGDKLLGSCQAGIIAGKRELVSKIRKHPLARALRIDKLRLSILETTLRIFEEQQWEELPTWNMITATASSIEQRANKIAQELKKCVPSCIVRVDASRAMAGSGSFPAQEIASFAVYIKAKISTGQLAYLLRMNNPSIFARMEEDLLVIDPRTLLPNEDQELAEILCRILTEYKEGELNEH